MMVTEQKLFAKALGTYSFSILSLMEVTPEEFGLNLQGPFQGEEEEGKEE